MHTLDTEQYASVTRGDKSDSPGLLFARSDSPGAIRPVAIRPELFARSYSPGVIRPERFARVAFRPGCVSPRLRFAWGAIRPGHAMLAEQGMHALVPADHSLKATAATLGGIGRAEEQILFLAGSGPSHPLPLSPPPSFLSLTSPAPQTVFNNPSFCR